MPRTASTAPDVRQVLSAIDAISKQASRTTDQSVKAALLKFGCELADRALGAEKLKKAA